jgi:hypothetical protein
MLVEADMLAMWLRVLLRGSALILVHVVLWSLHHLFSPALLLGSAFALGAFKATPKTPHLELSSSRRAPHRGLFTPSKCIVKPSIINLHETQNSYERPFNSVFIGGFFEPLLLS